MMRIQMMRIQMMRQLEVEGTNGNYSFNHGTSVS
jgi:hypothetical protein